jgi:FtsH-binding integral membrane protein
MSPETLKEIKNFTRQMKWCSIMCWLATLAFIFIPHTNDDLGWTIIPAGGVILTFIYFHLTSKIREYESK